MACHHLCLDGANVKSEDENKRPPIHSSVENGQTEFIKKPHKAGANINAGDKNDKNWTSLHVAAYICNAMRVQILLHGGANVNALNDNLQTPLHVAAKRGDKFIVKALLKAGANVNTEDDRHRTPLSVAYRWGHTHIFGTLRRAGANFDAGNDTQRSHLHDAAGRGKKEIGENLLQAGANVDAGNDKQGTAVAIKTESHTQSAKKLHVARKSTDGGLRYFGYNYARITTCEARDSQNDVTPSTTFANGNFRVRFCEYIIINSFYNCVPFYNGTIYYQN